MAYSDFKSVDEIIQKFGVSIVSNGSLFPDMQEIVPSDQLQAILSENIPLALNINTEKARSEFIIAPVLVEVRRIFHHQIALFSGIELNVDETLGLTGYCDFLMSRSPDQVFLKAPVVCIVEAKNENIKSGYPQCMAEMLAAQMLDERTGYPAQAISGVVTTGSNWRFLKLTGQTIAVDFDEYLISSIEKILGIFVEIIQTK